jgi:hypothetical protein
MKKTPPFDFCGIRVVVAKKEGVMGGSASGTRITSRGMEKTLAFCGWVSWDG